METKTRTYFIRFRGKVQGPFTLAELKKMRTRGSLSAFHEVSEDKTEWVLASSLVEIFSSVNAASGKSAKSSPSAVAPDLQIAEKPVMPLPLSGSHPPPPPSSERLPHGNGKVAMVYWILLVVVVTVVAGGSFLIWNDSRERDRIRVEQLARLQKEEHERSNREEKERRDKQERDRQEQELKDREAREKATLATPAIVASGAGAEIQSWNQERVDQYNKFSGQFEGFVRFWGQIKIRRTGGYRVRAGFYKDGAFHVGGILGTKYFVDHYISGDAGDVVPVEIRVYTFPPLNRTVHMEVE